MNSYLHKKLIKWVNENFNTDMNPNASDQNNQTHGYGAAHMVGGHYAPMIKDVNGEDLKKKFNGVNNLKDLKAQADNYLGDIKAIITSCEGKDATAANYSKLVDLLKKPEIISVIEHIKDELHLKEQEQDQYAQPIKQ